jgi:hypothetical protein
MRKFRAEDQLRVDRTLLLVGLLEARLFEYCKMLRPLMETSIEPGQRVYANRRILKHCRLSRFFSK